MSQIPASATQVDSNSNAVPRIAIEMGECAFSTLAPNLLLMSVQVLRVLSNIHPRVANYFQKRRTTFSMDLMTCTTCTTKSRRNSIVCWLTLGWNMDVI